MTDEVDNRSDSSSQQHVARPVAAKSKRPKDTALAQQRLKGWNFVVTPKSIIPLFFALGIILGPIGGLLFYANNKVEELVLDYSRCGTESAVAPEWSDMPNKQISATFRSSAAVTAQWQHQLSSVDYDGVDTPTTVCSVQFDIPNDIGPPVYFLYRLTNFFQNHRRYVKSFDVNQLQGKPVSASKILTDCNPLRIDDATNKPYYPCGLVANSVFNDTFSSPGRLTNPSNPDSARISYAMTKVGIAWKSDADLYAPTQYSPDQVVPPPNWFKRYPNGYTNQTGLPNIHTDEPFQVWMRTAGLPDFAKMARRNDSHVMSAGRYIIEIRDNFPVTIYSGTKSILISTRTVMGGENNFLAIGYFVACALCTIAGIAFTAANCVRPRLRGDHQRLSWNQASKNTSNSPSNPLAGPGMPPKEMVEIEPIPNLEIKPMM